MIIFHSYVSLLEGNHRKSPTLEVSDGFRFVIKVPPVIIQVMNEQFHIETGW